MKALACGYVYWPNMDKQLEDLARICTKCQLAAKSPRKSTLSSWPVPDSTWSRLHIDFAGPTCGQSFLVVVDAYSKWPEIFPMSRITSEETISKLQKIFSRFGLLETLVSDNGTTFSSVKFSTFCQQNGINHIRTPPFHPQSNSQVERLVDTFKRALLKFRGEGTMSEILETFLTSYWATLNPDTPNGSSPAESLMNRKIRLHIDVLHPKQHHSIRRNTKKERQYNCHHGSVQRKFLPGQQVLARDYWNNTWTQGHIVQQTGNVTYNVNVKNSIWVQHSNQLRPSHLPVEIQQDPTIPLNILLDTFDLLQQTPETFQNTEVETQKPNIRKLVRTCSPTQHLQVKSYK